MKKKLVAFLLMLVLAISVTSLNALADNDGLSSYASPTLIPISSFKIVSPDNPDNYVTINVSSDYVGFNGITTGLKVRACQSYTDICGGNSGGVDGIWGINSETGLRQAQQVLHDYGYTAVTSDGVCGPNTWRGFYSYCNGVPGSVQSDVWENIN